MGRPTRESIDGLRVDTSTANPDVFDDEFAVSTPLVSDYDAVDRDTRTAPATIAPPRSSLTQPRPVSQHNHLRPQSPSSSSRPNRSSIAKNGQGQWRGTQDRRRPSTSGQSSSRPVSATSFDSNRMSILQRSSFATHHDDEEAHASTSTGAAPSFPYALYAQSGVRQSMGAQSDAQEGQVTRARNNSTRHDATSTSTYRQEDLPSSVTPAARQRNGTFHRQLGPDGEDQGIVGPDGHVEQLPAYSKYPDVNEGRYATIASRPTRRNSGLVIDIPEVVSPISIDSPTEHGRAEATEPVMTPQSTAPLVSPIVPDQVYLQASPTSSGSTFERLKPDERAEKSWAEKNWRERRKARVIGGRIPLCWLLVAGGVFGFLSLGVIGGVIGAIVVRDRHQQPAMITITSTASPIGASPIPSPTGLAPLATGVFAIQLGVPSETLRDCVTESSDMSSWACNLAPAMATIELEHIDGQPPSASIYPVPMPSNAPLQYGAQPPQINANNLSYVIDKQNPSLGPALYFQTVYDKMVILPSNAFAAMVKRDLGGQWEDYNEEEQDNGCEARPPPPPPDYNPPTGFRGAKGVSRSMIRMGETPWFCYWNATFVEAFVYIQQTSSASKQPPSSSSPSSTAHGWKSSPSSSSSSSSSNSTRTASSPSSTSIHPQYRRHVSRHKKASSSSSESHSDPHSDPSPILPYMMKLKEARLPSANTPSHAYCQQMSVLQTGQIVPLLTSGGQSILTHISEQDPSVSQFEGEFMPSSSGVSGSSGVVNRLMRRDGGGDNLCTCKWTMS